MGKIVDHIKNRNFVKIKMNLEYINTINGYILDASEYLILIQKVEDFHIDGYQIVRSTDIEKIIYTKKQITQEKILIFEGVDKYINFDINIDLSNWKKVLHYILDKYQIIIVESENNKYEFFNIGKIRKMLNDYFFMVTFNADGTWNNNLQKILYKEITSLQFDNEYTNVWQRFLQHNKIQLEK